MPREEWKGIFKVQEEMGELAQVLGKLAVFPTGLHPDGKGPLKPRLEEEIGDVLAAISYFMTENGLDHAAIDKRLLEKHAKFKEWGLSGIRS